MNFNILTLYELREIARRWHILDYRHLTRKQLATRLAKAALENPTDLWSNRNRL